MEEAFEALNAELRLQGVLVYAERRDGFELRSVVGLEPDAFPEWVEPTCRSLALVRRHRVYLFADPDEDDSPWREGVLPRVPCAGLVVGRWPHRHMVFFLLDEGWSREPVDFALNVLRAALGLKLLEERVRINLRQAAEVQEGLVREAPPVVPGFEIACRSIRPRRSAVISTTSCRWAATSSASPSAMPAATTCRRPCSSVTWSPACAWAWRSICGWSTCLRSSTA